MQAISWVLKLLVYYTDKLCLHYIKDITDCTIFVVRNISNNTTKILKIDTKAYTIPKVVSNFTQK